jgi:hypothetical protein
MLLVVNHGHVVVVVVDVGGVAMEKKVGKEVRGLSIYFCCIL